MEKTSLDKLAEYFKHFVIGYTISKAVLEDYAIVVAKIEGCDAEVVKDRIQKRADEIRKEILESVQGDKRSNP